MSRRKDVFNSPEYRHIEENLDDILKELEGDEETRNMTMPEEWDKDFREILEKVNEENRQRHRKKLRRTIAAAAAVLIVSVPVIGFVGTETVEGDGILELLGKSVNFIGRRYGMAGTGEENLNFDSEKNSEITLSASSIEELNKRIDEEITHPFYKIGWVPEGFSVQEAVYNQEFDSLNIELFNGGNYIYVSQQFILDIGVQSNITQNESVDTVENSNIGMTIDIYKSEANTGLSFSIVVNNAKLDCYMETSMEECKMFAENILYD